MDLEDKLAIAAFIGGAILITAIATPFIILLWRLATGDNPL